MDNQTPVVRASRRAPVPAAPAQATWLISFADLMTLLMCMFVFLYSYAETSATRFREISESMRGAFTNQQDTQQSAETSASKSRRAEQLLASVFAPEVASGQLAIEAMPSSLMIRLGEAGAFGSGEATLTPMALQLIARVALVARVGNARLVIGGHTDNVPIRNGRYQDNWDLSAARAIAVVRELVEHQSVDPKQIEAQGFADTRPALANDTPAQRTANRRIEIAVIW